MVSIVLSIRTHRLDSLSFVTSATVTFHSILWKKAHFLKELTQSCTTGTSLERAQRPQIDPSNTRTPGWVSAQRFQALS